MYTMTVKTYTMESKLSDSKRIWLLGNGRINSRTISTTCSTENQASL